MCISICGMLIWHFSYKIVIENVTRGIRMTQQDEGDDKGWKSLIIKGFLKTIL